MYLRWGEECARGGVCWHPEHPLGAIQYFSLPYRLGYPAEFIIIFNFLLIAASVYLAGKVIQTVLPTAKRGLKYYLTWLGPAIGHFIFMAGGAWYSLSDVPSTSLALVGLWLLMLGMKNDRPSWLALAGLCLGTSITVRLVYYYPAAASLVCFAGLARYRKDFRWKTMLGVSSCFAAPLVIICACTFARIGHWSFVHPEGEKSVPLYHATAPFYGFDCVSFGSYYYEGRGFFKKWYDSPEIPGPPEIMGEVPYHPTYPVFEALKAGDYSGVARLYAKRQWYYFGSYAWHWYLASLSERTFSVFILLAHCLAAAFMVYFVATSAFKHLFAIPFVFAAITWACAALLIPEIRYLMMVHTLMWTLGVTGAAFCVLRVAEGPAGLGRRALKRYPG